MNLLKWLFLGAILGAIWFTLSHRKNSSVATNDFAEQTPATEEAKFQSPAPLSTPRPTPPEPVKPKGNIEPRPSSQTAIPSLNAAALPAVLLLNKEGFVTDERGERVHVYHLKQAEEACKKLGMELPSIRELVAQYGHLSNGTEEVPFGYDREQVTALNSDGKPDSFYYIYNSSGGALSEKSNKTDFILWSSSTDTRFNKEHFCFNAFAGYVCEGESVNSEEAAERDVIQCVSKKKEKH